MAFAIFAPPAEDPKVKEQQQKVEEQRKKYAPLLRAAIDLYDKECLTPEWERREAKANGHSYRTDAARIRTEFFEGELADLGERRRVAAFAKDYLADSVDRIEKMDQGELFRVLSLYHAHEWNILQYAKEPPQPEPPPVDPREARRREAIQEIVTGGLEKVRAEAEVRRLFAQARKEAGDDPDTIRRLNEEEERAVNHIRSRRIV